MNLQQIKKELPNGALREIAGKAEVSNSLVTKILNGQLPKSTKRQQVLKVTAEVLKRVREERKAVEMQLEDALNA